MWATSLLGWGCLIIRVVISAESGLTSGNPELITLPEAAASEETAHGRQLAYRGGGSGGASTSGGIGGGFDCSITSCEGRNLLSGIRSDLDLWRKRGGITLADTDRAMHRGCPVGEEDGHFFGCVPGWVRVMVWNGTLFATHFAEGFGTRDGVFLVAMLELLARYGHEVPDVDFVLQPGDRAKVLRHSSPATARWLPLMLSFAVHPDYQEVGVPDPSFWSWPEMGVPPHWQLLKDPDIVAWHKKASTAFWRGGSNRRFAEKTRKALLGCPSSAPEALQSKLDIHDAMRLAANKNATRAKLNGCKAACQDWVGPMAMCQHKMPIFAQGEGYTSSKQRVLACGALPAFLNHDGMDSYFGRWLTPNKHYKLLRANHVCDDLKNLVWWTAEHDESAQRIGVNARRFATRILGEEMVHQYLLHVLKEVAALQTYKMSEAWASIHATLDRTNALPAAQKKLATMEEAKQGTAALHSMVKLTPQTIAAAFRQREERKGAMIEAAMAYSPNLKNRMAPPHPSSAKYSHITNHK